MGLARGSELGTREPGKHKQRESSPDTERWTPTRKAPGPETESTQRHPEPDRESRAPTQISAPRHRERRSRHKTAGARRALTQKAPGPKERPTQIAAPRRRERRPRHKTAGVPKRERRAPTQRPLGSESAGARHRERQAPICCSPRLPLKSCLYNVGSMSCAQQPLTRDSAMCNSKEAKRATFQPMYFCPCCLGSVLVYFSLQIVERDWCFLTSFREVAP